MELDALLKPSWGSEKWILEGWNKLSHAEQETINSKVADLFQEGLPFEMHHDEILYVHLFALLTQLKVLAIQLPLQFEEKLEKPEFKLMMRQQLVDEVFHSIVFTKILFLLSAPYGSPPTYDEEIEKITTFARAQQCVKVGVCVLNLLCKGLLEEIFSNFSKPNIDIAPKLFEIIVKDEHRHASEADLYLEIGLPEQLILTKTLQTFEELILAAFSLEPRYAVAISSLLGPKATERFITTVHEKYIQQLKKINRTPSHQIDLLIEMSPSMFKEADQELRLIEMTAVKKAMMTQLNSPGDPTIVAQFNIDVTEFCQFQKEFSNELLTTLMMQAISLVLEENDSFRNFLSFKKLYQSKGAYVALVEKIADCGDHLATLCFKDCHELTVAELLFKIKKTELVMHHCYQKREHIEKEHPEFQQRLEELLQHYAHDTFPYPIPGSYGAYLSNIGVYGYTHAVSPLLKHTGLHILLLSIEKKPIWNPVTNSFDAKDILPISISADNRIFDGMQPLPELLAKAFKTVFAKMKKQKSSKEIPSKKSPKMSELLAKKGITHLLDTNTLAKEAKKILGADELEFYRQKITSSPNLRNLADELLLDYIGLNATENSSNFKKHVEKLLSENLELGYRILVNLQSLWCDYLDIENNFSIAYKNVAHKRLGMLAKLLPSLIKQSKKH